MTEHPAESNPPDRDATAPADPGGDLGVDHDESFLEPDDADAPRTDSGEGYPVPPPPD